MSVASIKKNCQTKFYKVPGFGRPNFQELWPWDLRTSCRFTVLCHSRALSPLSPCHCLVHLYDLQVSFSSRQMWLWFWHSKIQSEMCHCRNVWLMFKVLIWYDMQIWSWWFIVNGMWKLNFFVDKSKRLFCGSQLWAVTIPRSWEAMEYEQTKAEKMECFPAGFFHEEKRSFQKGKSSF